MARVLTFRDCEKIDLFSSKTIEDIERCFIDYSDKKCELKAKIVLRKEGDSFFTTMPAIYDDVMSIKSIQRDITVDQPSIRGMLILNDNITGNLLSIMDSTYLTAVRTGLTAYISMCTTTNVVEESKAVAVIGIGNAMISYLKALSKFKDQHCIRKIYVKKYKDHYQRVKDLFDCDFELIGVDDNEELMHADIIVSAITSATGNIIQEFNHNWKGKTIIPIHVRGWEHFDSEVDIVTTDFYEQTKSWIRTDAIELGDMLANKINVKDARKNHNVLSYNYGGALIDLVIAKIIYNKSIALGLGQEIDFWNMSSKYF